MSYNETFDRTKYRLLIVFITGGNTTVFIFSIILFFTGYLTGSAINFILSGFGYYCLYFVVKKKKLLIGSKILVSGFVLLCIYLYYSGGLKNTGYLWIFCLPMVVFFLEGNKKGLVVNCSFLFITFSLSFFHFLGLIKLIYTNIFIVIFHISYVVNCSLMYFIHRILEKAEEKLKEKINEVSALNKQLEYYSFYDTLTGIFNRRQIISMLTKEIERNKRSNSSFSILMFDVDYFKDINDNYGHLFGDYVLQYMIGNIYKNILRKSDSIGRYGGEEFLVLMPDTNLEGGKTAGERIRKYVEELEFLNSEINKKIIVTISIGISEMIQNDTLDELLRKADYALYEAKNKGRNRVEVYNKKV